MTIIQYMIPEVWSTTWRIFCYFRLFFAFLPPTNNPENQNFEKVKKKRLEILSFYTSVPKIMIIYYTVSEIWRVTDIIFILHFRLLFALFLPFYPPFIPLKNQNFTKTKKTPGVIFILQMCTKNYDQMMYSSWGMVRDGQTDRWTDERMDGQKNWYIEVGAPPKNIS